jgi:hypothetical protein
MKEQIGLTAGRVWQTLVKNGEVSLPQLPKLIKEKDAMVFQALGWLAREDKVKYRTEGVRTFVSAIK